MQATSNKIMRAFVEGAQAGEAEVKKPLSEAELRAGAAEALRLSQIEMAHSRSWRAKPLYWASYSLVGGER